MPTSGKPRSVLVVHFLTMMFRPYIVRSEHNAIDLSGLRAAGLGVRFCRPGACGLSGDVSHQGGSRALGRGGSSGFLWREGPTRRENRPAGLCRVDNGL
jgi:hypothetical protein